MQKLEIMLVDDEERFLSSTKKLLDRRGYKIAIASSGSIALKKLDEAEFHVVILDVKMPGMDGMEVLKTIKMKYPLVEVIMLTGHGTIESAVEGLKAGATDYLTKPADIDEIIIKAEEAFDKRKRLEEKIRMAKARQYMKSPREIIKTESRF
jgi:DNA-binding NtrC family response regulator